MYLLVEKLNDLNVHRQVQHSIDEDKEQENSLLFGFTIPEETENDEDGNYDKFENGQRDRKLLSKDQMLCAGLEDVSGLIVLQEKGIPIKTHSI